MAREKSWRFTGVPLAIPENPQGLMVDVTGLPTFGSDNVWRVGGAGQGAVELNLRRIVGQREEFDVGDESRALVGQMLGIPGRVEDQLMVDTLKDLTSNGDFRIDHEVDNHAISFVLDLLAEHPLAIVGTKLLPLLLQGHSTHLARLPEFNARVIPLMIGVSVSDHVATERKLKAHYEKMARQNQVPVLTSFQVAQTRAERYPQDRNKYALAYHGLDYSRRALDRAVHVVFDNEKRRSGTEMMDVLSEMLFSIAERFPQISPFLNQALCMDPVLSD